MWGTKEITKGNVKERERERERESEWNTEQSTTDFKPREYSFVNKDKLFRDLLEMYVFHLTLGTFKSKEMQMRRIRTRFHGHWKAERAESARRKVWLESKNEEEEEEETRTHSPGFYEPLLEAARSISAQAHTHHPSFTRCPHSSRHPPTPPPPQPGHFLFRLTNYIVIKVYCSPISQETNSPSRLESSGEKVIAILP